MHKRFTVTNNGPEGSLYAATGMDVGNGDWTGHRMLHDTIRGGCRGAESGSDGSNAETVRSVSRAQAESGTDAASGSSISIAAESALGAWGGR